jgi:hypothetical protein
MLTGTCRSLHLRRVYAPIFLFFYFVDSIKGIDHCYDCAAEIAILKRYTLKLRPGIIES